MKKAGVSRRALQGFLLYKEAERRRIPVDFELELTVRCNFDCRHCYNNRDATDKSARHAELSLDEIRSVGEQAVALGALHCTVTGGEPLLRPDFNDVYLSLRRIGLLVSVFTNATRVTRAQAVFFKKYPPRNLEVTVFGASRAGYERVTRRNGAFDAAMRGLDALRDNGVPVRLKAMALRSNVHEMAAIRRFCRRRTKDYFRFDPFLHLRTDGDEKRNQEIRNERLSADEIVALERSDRQRFRALVRGCDSLVRGEPVGDCTHLFYCGAGRLGFSVSYDGRFRLCSSLNHRECVYSLRQGSLAAAWSRFAPRVLDRRSTEREFVERCSRCRLVNLCLWCPAHAHLETGSLDRPVDYFCEVAHARARLLTDGKSGRAGRDRGR